MKLNIALLNESFPPTIDGVSNTVFNYAKILKNNHCDCTVITPQYPNVVDDYDFDVYRYKSFDLSKKIGYRVGNVLSPKMLYDLKSKHFDLLHIHSPFASSVIASELLKIGYKMPVVITYHTKFDVDIKKRVNSAFIQKAALRFLKHNLNNATEVWSVTSTAEANLRSVGYKGRCITMENGTDFKKGVSSEEECAKMRLRYGIRSDCPILLFVGRMMWYKNTKLIFDAVAKLQNDFQLVMVGDGADRAAMEQYVRQIGIADKVVFAGAIYDREQVRVMFSLADLFLFPSTYDTSGLVVKEAAACSLASVLVSGSCAAEGVFDGVNGFLCRENADDLFRAIGNALSDKDRLKTVGENASQTIYLSWEDSIARAYNRYCEIVSQWDKPLPYQYRR